MFNNLRVYCEPTPVMKRVFGFGFESVSFLVWSCMSWCGGDQQALGDAEVAPPGPRAVAECALSHLHILLWQLCNATVHNGGGLAHLLPQLPRCHYSWHLEQRYKRGAVGSQLGIGYHGSLTSVDPNEGGSFPVEGDAPDGHVMGVSSYDRGNQTMFVLKYPQGRVRCVSCCRLSFGAQLVAHQLFGSETCLQRRHATR